MKKQNNIYVTLGASNHSKHEREKHDYYATDPRAVEMLLELEQFDKCILEPCCGKGHISNVLIKHGYNVRSFDLIERGFGTCGIDFLKFNQICDCDIITNPPYSMAQEFIEHALNIITSGHKIAMFLKLTFLEGKRSKKLFEKHPPKHIYVSSSRMPCGRNGEFFIRDKKGNIITDKKGTPKAISSAICYAWFVWEKGYTGDIILKHFN
ncbi:MAG: hypothetical protein IKM23_06720 [Bacteroidales bacterium]|nr:hypothetical protein [Bacteroidales bacterium]